MIVIYNRPNVLKLPYKTTIKVQQHNKDNSPAFNEDGNPIMINKELPNIHFPASIDDAINLLAENPEWKPLAGGTDLLVSFRTSRYPLQTCGRYEFHSLLQCRW